MKKSSKPRCPQCRILEADLASVKADMARLREELAALRKTSSTSSKPPSTDIVKPKPAVNEEDGPKRTIGGQPGHAKHEREPFPAEQVTKFLTHTLDACPDCGGQVRRNGPLQSVVQQIDIVEIPLSIEQHTCPQYWCDHCRKPCSAPLPLPIERGGLLGPNLTALIAFMKGGLIMQGTRSEAGQQWCERIWTAMATCAQQGRSAYAFLAEAIFSWFEGKPGPSLLPEMGLA